MLEKLLLNFVCALL